MNLQSGKTKNVGEATSRWTSNWRWIIGGGAAVFVGIGTPAGRKYI